MAGIFGSHQNKGGGFAEWLNRPVVNRGFVAPIAQDAETGAVQLAWPGMVTEPLQSLARVLMSGGRTDTTYDDAGVPVSGRGTLSDLDGLNVAGIAPLGTMALGTAAGAIERGAMGAGPVRAAADLPMDQASRLARARQMGFDTDTVLYHGTGSKFDAFDQNYIGGVHGADGLPGGFDMTPNKNLADWHASKHGPDGLTMPLVTKGEDGPWVDLTGSKYWTFQPDEALAAAEAAGVKTGPQTTTLDVLKAFGSPDQARQRLMDSGVIGIIHETDRGLAKGGGQTYRVFDPRNIRSVNAAFDPAMSDSANLLAANPKTAAAPLALNALEKPKGFTAYHGSPHDFDKFDLSKIGTGEGAQAYGHGLYFAENEGVARSYRDQLGGRDVKAYGEQVPFRLGSIPEDTLSMELHRTGDIDSAIAALESAKKEYGFIPPEEFDAVIARAQQMKADRAVESSPKGRMYEVRINADPEQLLDLDKPFAQQPDHVRGVLSDVLKRWEPDTDLNDKYMFQDVIRDPDTSRALVNAGIPGIRYLDQMSRSAGDGSRNYVLFDDSLVDIMRKYANAPTGAAAPLAISGQGQEQDNMDINALLRAYGLQ